MTIRTTQRNVSFGHPFSFTDAGGPYPPGEYLVLTDEEVIPELSFPVWRRVKTTIHLRSGGATQAWTIDPDELERLLLQDNAASSA